MRFSDVPVRAELAWDAHLEAAPGWLLPFLEVPDDAAPPLAMTPVHPFAVGSYGPAACAWMEDSLGLSLRWWQRLAIVRQLEHREDARLCWSGMVESASRRAGKSLRLRGMALWRLAHSELFGEPQLAIHTGKDLAIVREIQRGAWRWAEERDWRVVRAIGRESIENDEHRWLARSTDGVYGYDVTLGMVDEAWAVDVEVVSEGLEPAALERSSPQVVLTSTAHRRATGLMRGRIRDALAAEDDATVLLLWSSPDGADLGDEATWRMASAHWSEDRARLLAAKYAKAAAGQQDPDFDDPDPMLGFASQYLNRWQLRAGRAAVNVLPGWSRLAAGRPAPGTMTAAAFGVAMDPEETVCSVAALLKAEGEGRQHLALLDRWPASDAAGFAQRVAELRGIYAGTALFGVPVLLDSRGPASVLADPLRSAGLVVTGVDLDGFVTACSGLVSAVETGAVEHGAYPDLDAAVSALRWRRRGERRAFDRYQGDVSAAEAAALALHGAQPQAAGAFFGGWR